MCYTFICLVQSTGTKTSVKIKKEKLGGRILKLRNFCVENNCLLLFLNHNLFVIVLNCIVSKPKVHLA